MSVNTDGTCGTLRRETHGHEPVVAYGLDEEQNETEEFFGTLKARQQGGGFEGAVAFAENSRAELRYCGGDGKVSSQLTTGGGKPGQGSPCVAQSMAVRRLTPIECERLQGFPDNFTRIPWRNKPAEQCPDGPRYKALGNSMAVNVMEWIGERIQMVEGEL